MTSTGSVRPDMPHRREETARRVADLVRFDIHSGRFEERLPHEWDLLRRYGASRGVLREALARPIDEGVLRRVPGIGALRRVDNTALSLTQVAAPLQVVDAESGPAAEIDESRMLAETIAHERSNAPLPVAEALAIAPGDPVLFTESLPTSTGRPTGCGRAGSRSTGCRVSRWPWPAATRSASCGTCSASRCSPRASSSRS